MNTIKLARMDVSGTLSYADQIIPAPPSPDQPVPSGPRYIIATTQRSGSTLLGDALVSTEVAGELDEWFTCAAAPYAAWPNDRLASGWRHQSTKQE
jgi:hypothetical protein